MMANAESSTCRSEAIVTGGGQVAIAEHHIYDYWRIRGNERSGSQGGDGEDEDGRAPQLGIMKQPYRTICQ
jgi:hypothetical protein